MILVLRLALVAAIGLVCARHAEAADLTPPHYSAVGLASWYGSDFHGHATADGEIFDMGALSAAHRSLPLPCYARVTNLGNGRSIVVRVNDRGPFVGGRILDVSARVAKLLEFNGITKIRVEYVGKAPPAGSDGPMLLASLQTGSAAAAAPPSPPAGFDLPALLAHLSGAPAVAQPAPVGLSQAAPPSAADEGVTAAARVVELRKAPDKDAPAAAPPPPPAGFDLAALLASVHSGGAPAAAQPAPVEVTSTAQPSAPDEGVTVAARVVEHRTAPYKGATTATRVVERRKAPDKGVVVATRVVERPQAADKGVTVAARVVEPPALAARPAFGNAKIVMAGVVGPPPVAKPLSPFGDLLASPFLAQTARP
ncbi:MAG: septal ring lytic transglycosylase RlpA family protein [Roseiarcus sp.]